jgi:RNA polymerase sigma-70 factor (ECF subfamily)
MEEAAFASLYETTHAALWGYVAKGVRDPVVADDIVQESYVRLLQADVAALDPGPTKAYLYRIATNLMTDHWRRRKREAAAPEDAADRAAHPAPDDAMAAGPDVEQALAGLAPRERSLLWLAYVEGHAHREIAEILSVREKSVRVLLHRARKKMAGLLRPGIARPSGAATDREAR